MKKFRLLLEERIYGEFEIEANTKEEAKAKFWDEIHELDLCSIMQDSEGIDIIETEEVE